MEKPSAVLRLQKLIWVFIYGGLLSLVLGIFLAPADLTLARAIQAVGAVFVVLGVLLIYLRSRIKDTEIK